MSNVMHLHGTWTHTLNAKTKRQRSLENLLTGGPGFPGGPMKPGTPG